MCEWFEEIERDVIADLPWRFWYREFVSSFIQIIIYDAFEENTVYAYTMMLIALIGGPGLLIIAAAMAGIAKASVLKSLDEDDMFVLYNKKNIDYIKVYSKLSK